MTRWWLAQVADVRLQGTTKKPPLELHAEELPHLLPILSLAFDTARVVSRIVDTDGTVQYANNRYSVPWRLVMALLDRVVGSAITIRFDGKSYRQHRAEQMRSSASNRSMSST